MRHVMIKGAVALAAMPAFSGVAHAALPLYGPYQIRNAHSGKCLEIPDGRTDNGVSAQQWACDLNANTQHWVSAVTCVECSDPAYHITNFNSWKELEVENSSTANGARVQQWEYAGAPGQFWHYR